VYGSVSVIVLSSVVGAALLEAMVLCVWLCCCGRFCFFGDIYFNFLVGFVDEM
jgi:hypothetical protein